MHPGEAVCQRDPLRSTLALVLAGGSGSRLRALTEWHSKPALPVAGNYRNVDFPLSNCVNSGIRRIAVLTQYKAHSLIQHLSKAWSFLRPELGEFVELWPAQQRRQSDWYTGTANAVFQNLDIIEGHAPDYVLVLAGDHVYKMDYGAMLRRHVASGADVTVGCIDVPVAQASQFGIVCGRPDGLIEDFVEKPLNGEAYADASGRVMASMGIYVFSAPYLRRALEADAVDDDSDHDFGHNVIPAAVHRARVCSYLFQCGRSGAHSAYWRDVGTLDAYWQTHMELLGDAPPLDLGDPCWPILSYREPLPPARFVSTGRDAPGTAVDSLVSDGCVIRGAMVVGSVLFPRVWVDAESRVSEAVVLPGARIGRRCRLRRVIIESDCEIPDGTIVGEDAAADRARFHVSEQGIVLVTADDLRAAVPERVDRAASGSSTPVREALTRVACVHFGTAARTGHWPSPSGPARRIRWGPHGRARASTSRCSRSGRSRWRCVCSMRAAKKSRASRSPSVPIRFGTASCRKRVLASATGTASTAPTGPRKGCVSTPTSCCSIHTPRKSSAG